MTEPGPMSRARLRALLEAYGADLDRWPPNERDAGRALLAQAPEARGWRDRQQELDALLDLVPAAEASPGLVDRILTALPQAHAASDSPTHQHVARVSVATALRQPVRRSRPWRYVGAALPVAAAAALVLWLLAEQAPAPPSTTITIAELGTYGAPSDVLLDAPGSDTLNDVPAFGCSGSGLGCLDAVAPDQQSAITLERIS